MKPIIKIDVWLIQTFVAEDVVLSEPFNRVSWELACCGLPWSWQNFPQDRSGHQCLPMVDLLCLLLLLVCLH